MSDRSDSDSKPRSRSWNRQKSSSVSLAGRNSEFPDDAREATDDHAVTTWTDRNPDPAPWCMRAISVCGDDEVTHERPAREDRVPPAACKDFASRKFDGQRWPQIPARRGVLIGMGGEARSLHSNQRPDGPPWWKQCHAGGVSLCTGALTRGPGEVAFGSGRDFIARTAADGGEQHQGDNAYTHPTGTRTQPA
jgi:hypothetical protein